MTLSDTRRDNGEEEDSIVSKDATATKRMCSEELSTRPAVSDSSKPRSVLVQSCGEKEGLLDNEDIMSDIQPVVELPPPPGSNLRFEINKRPAFDIV